MKKRIISLAVILMVGILILNGMSLPTAAGASNPPTAIDCSAPDSSADQKEIKASDFLTMLGGEIGAAEARYVDAVLGEALIYSDRIPTAKVKANYDGETVFVLAESYEYISSGGVSVKWIPYAVSLEGREYELSYSDENRGYECEIKFAASRSEDDYFCYVDVKYAFELTVSKDDAERFLNYTYTRAIEIDNEICEYELALAAYNDYVAYAEEKRKYDAAYELYEKYLTDMATYEAACSKYEQYGEQYEAYLAQLEAYRLYKESLDTFPDRFAAYEEYLDLMDKYESDTVKYRNYLAVMEKAEKKLAIMDNMFIRNSKGQVMYSTLKGPTVQQVLDNQELLISYGKVDPAVIVQTGDATDALRELLREYNKLTDFNDRYDYYVKNYESIKTNFITLYQNLYQLYQNEAVYAGIVQKERLDRYVEFVSHLYMIQSCLDDRYAINPDWKIHREYDEKAKGYVYYSYSEILEACQILNDHNNYSPYDLMTLPEKVNEPQKPAAVEPPEILPAVSLPVEPEPVYKPVRPETVEKPTEPTNVPYAEKPAEKTYLTVETGIRSEYLMGKLAERRVDGDIKLTFTTNCIKSVSVDDKYIVIFYDSDGTTVLYQYYANYGDTVSYGGELPSKNSTDKYTYTFSGWKNEDGSDAVFGEVTEYETVFYASYAGELNEYKIVWVVNGVSTVEYYKYGETPSFGGNTDKPADKWNVYTFAGWDVLPEKVVCDAIYSAKYTKTDRLYTVTFDVGGTVYREQYKYGEMPVFSYSTDIPGDGTYVYEFKGWDSEIVAVEGDASYVAQYDKKSIVVDEEGGEIETTPPPSTEPEENKYNVSVPGNTVKVDVLVESAAKSNSGIVLSWFSNECTVSFSEVAVAEFAAKGGAYVSFEKKSDCYSLRLYSADNEDIILDAPVSVIIKRDDVDKYLNAYLRNGSSDEVRIPISYLEGEISVKLSSSGEVILKKEYSVTVNSFVGGAIVPNMREAMEGDRVTFTLSVDADHLIKEISVVGDISGERYALDSENGFVMPSEPVTVTVSAEEKTYTVIFMVDGEVISSKTYRKGEIIECPEDPEKEATDTCIYQFLEWDPLYKEGTAVNGDVTYNAVFKELLIEDQEDFVPDEDNRFIEFVVAVILTFVLVLAMIIISTVIIVRMIIKKKKRKKRKSNSNGI